MRGSLLVPGPVLVLGLLLLLGAAWLRGPEHDEAYTLLIEAGHPRPGWPGGVFLAAQAQAAFRGAAGWGAIAETLRRTDVHPPLYFWALAAWREAAGQTWFAARVFSVLCAGGALALAGRIAGRAGIPVRRAMAMALLAYGFGYTGIVARDFALAQLLVAAAVARALGPGGPAGGGAGRGPLGWLLEGPLVGALLGAACFCNYLAVFPACVLLAWLGARRAGGAALAMAPFLAGDAWFFLAQRAARAGQFPAFHWGAALGRLAAAQAAAVLGETARLLPWAGVPLGLLLALLGLAVARRLRGASRGDPRLLFAGLAASAPAGLLLLGLVFRTTPIEIRYLWLGVPWIALLMADAASPRLAAWTIGAQAAGFGLMALAPGTMQAFGAAARQAAAVERAVPGAVTLLARGHDGVGVDGPFLYAAPPWLRVAVSDGAGPLPPAPGYAVPLVGVDGGSRAEVARLVAAAARAIDQSAAQAGTGARDLGGGAPGRRGARALPTGGGSAKPDTPPA